MMIKKPKFWNKKKPNFFAYLLMPFSQLVNFFNIVKKGKNFKFPNIKTICIGNIYIGGTGKTPLSIKVCQLLNKKNIRSTVLKKFYNEHKDEQLLISNKTNLISKKNRKKCLENAIEKNYEFAVFDDGLQDKSIKYDLKICCFNSSNWIGNGCIIPAGPLREKMHAIKNFDIVFLNGPNKENENIKTKIFEINSNIKIFEGRYKVKNSEKLDKTQNYLAFSGIGNPENFYITLKEINLNISKYLTFPDHYNYKKLELDNIKKYATKNNLKIITTEKDYLRINKEFRQDLGYIEMDLEIVNEKQFLDLVSKK